MNTPLRYTWDGEAFYPRLPRFADKQFCVGEDYWLVQHEPRSQASHGHYFVVVEEAFRNLPEVHAGRWPTSEHLRKWALVQAGFCDITEFLASSKAEALRLAAYQRSIDEFAVVTVHGQVMRRATAKSQSVKAMSRKDFQASKTAVLEILSTLVGVTPATLATEAGKAA